MVSRYSEDQEISRPVLIDKKIRPATNHFWLEASQPWWPRVKQVLLASHPSETSRQQETGASSLLHFLSLKR